MKLKFYLIIICLIVFGCKKKFSYEGILIHRNDLPFRGYNMSYVPENDIYLQTSKKDSNFPDGIRYYLIIPKDREYQNFKNNLGRKVKANGIELEGISYITYMVLTDPDYVDTNEKELYVGLYHYYLEDAKIVKVY